MDDENESEAQTVDGYDDWQDDVCGMKDTFDSILSRSTKHQDCSQFVLN